MAFHEEESKHCIRIKLSVHLDMRLLRMDSAQVEITGRLWIWIARIKESPFVAYSAVQLKADTFVFDFGLLWSDLGTSILFVYVLKGDGVIK